MIDSEAAAEKPDRPEPPEPPRVAASLPTIIAAKRGEAGRYRRVEGAAQAARRREAPLPHRLGDDARPHGDRRQKLGRSARLVC